MDYRAKAARLAALLDDRFGARGGDLSSSLMRVGRVLPKKMLANGKIVATAAEQEGNPKLARQINAAEVDRAFREMEKYLRRFGRSGRMKALGLSIVTTGAFNLVVLVVALVAFLRWRGFI